MKKRNLVIVISLVCFTIIATGISYGYFTYNRKVADVSLDTGSISINLANINGSINLNNMIPKTDGEGINSTDYVDFTVNATVDTDNIYYEIYLLPKADNTLDTSYLKTYLTDQTNKKYSEITPYNNLSNSEKTGGKTLYKGLVTINNDNSIKNYTKNFRLRLWLDENYSVLTSKTFEFDIYLYAYNVTNTNASNISYGNDENCNTVQCQIENIVGVY